MVTTASSHQSYHAFLESYKRGGVGDSTEPRAEAHSRRMRLSSQEREHVRAYAQWLRPHLGTLAGVLVLSLVTIGLQMAEPLFMRFIVDGVLLNDTLQDADRLTYLHLAGAAFLVVIVLASGLGIVRDYWQRLLSVRVTLTLRRTMFRRLMRLPLPKLSEMKTGGILSRLTGDIDATSGLLNLAIISPAVSLIRLLVAMGILLVLNWQLALVALAIIPVAAMISFSAASRIRSVFRAVRNDVQEIDGRVGEAFSGIRVVRSFGREMRELLEYVRGRHGVARKELFAYRRQLVLITLWGFLVSGFGVLIVWYGGYLMTSGRASIGDIMAFQWYAFLLLNPVAQIVNSFSELQRSLAATERVFDVLSMPEDKSDKPNAVDAPETVREIRFEGVQFGYREGRPVVSDFNVTVPGGKVVALVGRSGAGKTTVTDLVARFHDPSDGRILLNGTDIRQLRLRSYRNLFAIVQQDVFLFDGTIRDNIAYGNLNATDDEIEQAARRANAHEFISNLPEGYDTRIGERGVELSGGQQQRLSLARAILASPQILILDEATSALDSESEQLIQESMETLLEGRTTFVVAHRLSTVRRADLILFLEDGRIVESGNHDELMAERGKYHDMVVRQMEHEPDAIED